MKLFELKKQKMVVAHLNLRTEKHGEDEVLAEDVTLKADMSSTFLDELAPGLRRALFAPAEGASGDMLDTEHLPRLLYPALGTLGWAGKMEHAQFRVHGAKKADDLVFEGEVKKLSVTPMEGGSVGVEFKVGILPDADETGLLAAMLGQEVRVSISEGAEPEEDSTKAGKDREAEGAAAGQQSLH